MSLCCSSFARIAPFLFRSYKKREIAKAKQSICGVWVIESRENCDDFINAICVSQEMYNERYNLGCHLTIETDGDCGFILKRGSEDELVETEVLEISQHFVDTTMGTEVKRIVEFDSNACKLIIKTWTNKVAWRNELEIIGGLLLQTDYAANGTVCKLFYVRADEYNNVNCDTKETELMSLLSKE